MALAFFGFWVALMLACVLAVPVVSMMEKRKYQASHETYDSGEVAADDDEDLVPLDDDDGGEILAEGAVDEAEPAADPDDPFGTGAPDDFSAFDEEFK